MASIESLVARLQSGACEVVFTRNDGSVYSGKVFCPANHVQKTQVTVACIEKESGRWICFKPENLISIS